MYTWIYWADAYITNNIQVVISLLIPVRLFRAPDCRISFKIIIFKIMYTIFLLHLPLSILLSSVHWTGQIVSCKADPATKKEFYFMLYII